jgi:hypothetical protein
MWCRTLARLRNMLRWESSPVDVQCAHTKRVTVTRPVPDPAGPGPAAAAAEPGPGTGTDAMITDATAASSSVLVTDSCMRATCPVFLVFTCKSALYVGLYTSHAKSSVAKTFQSPLVLGAMPTERPPAGKKKAKGALAIAMRMGVKAKDGNEKARNNGGAVKGKVKRQAKAAESSAEGSELDELVESERENSSEESILDEPEVSQLKTKRRTKPATPLVEVTFSFFIFFIIRLY